MRRRYGRAATFRKWLRRLGWLLAVLFVSSWLLVLPLRWLAPTTSAFMLQDKSGLDPVLYEWQPWAEIGVGPSLAVVAAEDQKFSEHFGFDVKSIEDAIEDYDKGRSLRGASTISQQVAKNLFLWPGRSFVRKGIEAYFTALIEIVWPKKRILEIYLNIAQFGPGIYGVPAASRYYFDREPSQIADSDAALLAAVLPNPHKLQVDRPSGYVRERQRWIYRQMQRLRREHWLVTL